MPCVAPSWPYSTVKGTNIHSIGRVSSRWENGQIWMENAEGFGSSFPYERVAEGACIVFPAEQNHLAVGRVVGHGLEVTRRGLTRIGLLGPVGSIPHPGIVQRAAGSIYPAK